MIVLVLDQEWGVQLSKLAVRHRREFPRLLAVVSDEGVAAADRRFSVYLQALIDDMGGAQLRGQCREVRKFLTSDTLDLSRGWTVAADHIEEKLVKIRAGETTVADLCNEKVAELLPAHFLYSCPDVVDKVQPGQGFEVALGLLKKLRQFGRLTDGKPGAQFERNLEHKMGDLLDDQSGRMDALLTDAEVKQLNATGFIPEEVWNTMTGAQRRMVHQKRQGGSAAEGEEEAEGA